MSVPYVSDQDEEDEEDDEDDCRRTVVIELGSRYCKAGFEGESTPTAYFPSIVGKGKYVGQHFTGGVGTREYYVGHDADSEYVHMQRFPLSPRNSTRFDAWTDVEKIWHHTFYNELRVDPQEHPVLLAEPPLTTKACRERMVEAMFQTFQTPCVYIASQAVLSLYGTGRTSGLVLDCGERLSSTVPVYEGYALPHAILTLEVAGRAVEDYLMKLLPDVCRTGHTVARIKEGICYVARDAAEEQEHPRGSPEEMGVIVTVLSPHLCPVTASIVGEYYVCVEREWQLPDGEVVVVGKERFLCPEALFNPSLVLEATDCKDVDIINGVHHNIYSSIMMCHADLHQDLFANIVLSGGSTLFPGFAARVEKEVQTLQLAGTSQFNVQVVALPNRKILNWVGGAMFAALSSFPQQLISKQDYEDAGPAIVHKKCFGTYQGHEDRENPMLRRGVPAGCIM